MYGEPSVLYRINVSKENSISPANIFERSENSGGTLEKGLDTIIINTLTILVNKKDCNTQCKENTYN